MFNFPAVASILGVLLMLSGGLMSLSLPFSIYYGGEDFIAFSISIFITVAFGYFLKFSNKKNVAKAIKKRDAYLIVGSSYFIVSFFGSLPYLLSGAIPDFTNAYFETASGLTTTGASIMSDIEAMPKGILFWRSLTQWIGGMGIILLTVAILPYFGIGGMELFVAEVPGPTKEKLHPRIKETAKRLWFIYLGLTIILSMLLFLEGMNVYDAINHALTTLSSGGFSTKNASLGHWDSPLIQYTVIVFMFLAGVNFTLHYFALKGRFKDIFKNEEFRLYIILIFVFTIIVSTVVVLNLAKPLEKTFREVLFSVVSMMTTTGFVTTDYTAWMPFVTFVFFLLLFSGGSAGSTSGGMKLIRWLMLVRNSKLEFKRILHPRAIIPVRYNGHVLDQQLIYNILAFFVIYIVIFAVGSFLLAMMDMDLLTSMSAVATSIGNVGPGIGSVGPVNNFEIIPPLGKWLLAVLMIIGRLEIFTVLIIFTPFFWKRN